MLNKLKVILNSLLEGTLETMTAENITMVSQEAVRIIQKPEPLDQYDVMCMGIIISISQIVYNNTDRTLLFLDDGIYDLLLERYRVYNENFQVGAPVIHFDQNGEETKEVEYVEPISFISDDPIKFIENSLYYQDLSKHPPLDLRLFPQVDRNSGILISKKNVNVPHMYPKLVGSLDKCKFTLDSEAIERGVYNDPSVKIFERDFLGKHLRMGLIDMNTPFELIAELKYDGVSIEADVTHEILSARSRGDTNNDLAADMSEIFRGYRFPYAKEIPLEEAFGMKFEAIMTYANLNLMSMLRGKEYKNSRNGIIGLLGASDAYDYRDLITLVPLATSFEGIDRVTEIEFLNKYYHSGEYLRYSILRGTYVDIMYQVYQFVKEAESMRNSLPFMYDGVVISYRDPKIIEALGRENSINKYSMAIKFNPQVRETMFLRYSYTVGQDGVITPMIHYNPVEFYGTIHTKSSGHSYKRFMDLALAEGDIIQVEYTNDVMPYVTKPRVTKNFLNNKTPIPFPEFCPFCNSKVIIMESGKSAICPNINCPDRVVSRIANMAAKLGLKDFGEETFRRLGTKSLTELFNYTYMDVAILGDTNANKLLQRINELKTTPIYDFKAIGAIGFTGVAIETWKKILNVLPFNRIIADSDDDLYDTLLSIKSIGPKTAEIIVKERHYFKDDIYCIFCMPNIVSSLGMKASKVIRFTGCRPDDDLYNYLCSRGCDANKDGSVTKNTDILVVPYIGFSSSKTSKIGIGTRVVDMVAFKSNPDAFL